MTDVIKDVQKQDPGSAFIELFEIDLPGTNAFFHSGLTNEDLLGKKIYRRTTLYKYCYGQSGDANPPIEFPQQMWFIDRIAEKTAIHIEFELASPFDLAGVSLPRRSVVANACSWKYQGSSPEISIANQNGGCTWSTYSRITDTDGTVRTAYFNKKDEEYKKRRLDEVAKSNSKCRPERRKKAREEKSASYYLELCRKRMWHVFNGRETKSDKTLNLLGCDGEFLKTYLESTKVEGKDYTNAHIDHIIPCSSFDFSDEEQQRKCFHYTNLQLLPAEENLKKSNTILT